MNIQLKESPKRQSAGQTAPQMDRPPSDDLEAFVYLISHDVRSSVRALMEIPQWIKEDLVKEGHALSDDLRENIDLMNIHTRRLDQMMRDLLIYSRVGRMQTIRPIKIETVILGAMAQLQITDQFEIHTDLACDSITMGDRDIHTLFLALLSNSVKHHDLPQGKIWISSKRRKDSIVVRFRDDGPGIPAEFHGKVFEAMTTLKPRDDVEGSGMGLANLRKIMHCYQGRVAFCNSESARGTCLELHFPAEPQSRN